MTLENTIRAYIRAELRVLFGFKRNSKNSKRGIEKLMIKCDDIHKEIYLLKERINLLEKKKWT